MSGNVFELETIQVRAFKNLIECLKDILMETNLNITTNGIRFDSTDAVRRDVMVNLRLDAKKFDKFVCKEPLVIGLNLDNFFRIIKSLTDSCTLKLYVKDDKRDKLGITINNSDKTSNITMKLLDINQEDLGDLDSEEFGVGFRMSSAEFKKIMSDMNQIVGSKDNDRIEIKTVNHMLFMTCKGDYAEQEIILEQRDEEDDIITIIYKNDPKIVICSTYSLGRLCTFSKCATLCPNVDINMNTDNVIVLRYNIGNLGYMQLTTAPKIENI